MNLKWLNSLGIAVLFLQSACSPNSSTPQSTISPTMTLAVASVPTEVASPTVPTVTPIVAASNALVSTPIVRLSDNDVFCPTKIKEAQDAYNAAVDLKNKDDYSKAEQLYLQAIESDPTFCDAMDNLGQLLRQQGKVDEAIGWYLKSLKVRPENTMALQNIGLAYGLRGESDKAISSYERLVAVAPDNPEGYFGLGSTYLSLRQSSQAIKYLEIAESLYIQNNSPYVSDAQYYLGLAYFDLENCQKVKEYFDPLYDQYSELDGINYALGMCYLTAKPGDIDKAKKYILKAQDAGVQIPADVLKVIGDLK